MKKGFTLIEMLVTIIIIGIISATSVVSLKQYRGRSYFNEAVAQVHGEVLKAQSLAMASSKENIANYTLSFTGEGNYEIKEVADGTETSVVDSGKINGVALSQCEPTCVFVFRTNNTADSHSVTITDLNTSSGFKPKIITVNEAGSVEISDAQSNP